jgi:hypothetical protein
VTFKHSFFKRNGLSITLSALFLLFMGGQTYFGWHEYNAEQKAHSEREVTLPEYLSSGHFIEATTENWESEFLQMFAYVLLTVRLFQKGSSESKSLSEAEEVDRDPRSTSRHRNAPWPVKRGGMILKVYENSLSLAFLLLFIASIGLHAIGGARAYNADQLAHGEDAISVWEYSRTSQFWFESFQNWQSEFLALLAMVVLSIWLRQRGSPESKPVDAPHSQTGEG